MSLEAIATAEATAIVLTVTKTVAMGRRVNISRERLKAENMEICFGPTAAAFRS